MCGTPSANACRHLAGTDFTVQIMPPIRFNTDGPLVVALAYDGLCIFEFGIAVEVFGLARPEMGSGWYRFASAAVEPGPLRAQGGLTVTADGPLDLVDAADLIIVPGWKGVDARVPQALADRLRAAHDRGARLASICSGAFVLAATGLLDGGVVTTHWRYAEALQARHPRLSVDPASLYRQEGRVFTAAGSAAGLDLMLEIVRQDFGPVAANSVARRLVMPAHRDGGQAQFLESPVAVHPGRGVGPVMERVRADLGRDWTVAGMAQEACMSPRSFQRHFKAATGLAPADWLVATRIEEAKRLLVSGRAPVERVAEAAGFASAFTFRRQFRRRVGVSPRDYRARFFPGAQPLVGQ